MRKNFPKRRIPQRLKKVALVTSSAIVVLVVITLVFPQLLASGLNLIGLRGGVSFTVFDTQRNAPLADIPVTINAQTERTNRSGEVTFEDIELGKQQIEIEISGYAPFSSYYEIGWRDNQQQQLKLEPTGATYTFQVRDWLSKKPISQAEIAVGSRRTYTDDGGAAFLTIAESASQETVFSVNADGYAEQAFTPTQDKTDTTLDLVINEKHYFIGRSNSRQNVFSISADGQQREVFFSGQSDTTDDMQFSLGPQRHLAALVSSAVGSRVSDLMLLNLQSGEAETIDTSKYIKLVGWVNRSLIYIKENDTATTQDPERFSLIAHNTETQNTRIIDSSNVFNDVLVAQGYVFYAPSGLYEENTAAKLYRTRADGGNPLVIMEGPVWSIVRSGFATLNYFANQKWYEAALDSTSPSLSEQAGEPVNRLYTLNPYDSSLASWVEFGADGIGKLHVYEQTSDNDSVILELEGLRDPIIWLDERHLVFRVNNGREVADYVYSIDGGEPQKLADVSDVPGVDDWYYYYD